MSKTEVYSWRVDSDLKQSLEGEARAEKTSVGALLDRIVREWLGRELRDEDDAAVQRQLHEEAEKWIGSINSGDPYGSERVKERVRAKIVAKHRRLQRDAPSRSD
jgi:hypothetical protein